MSLLIGLLCGLFLAFANGANDNFKGVATLFGSGTTDYRKALLWATATTALGSLVALIWAKGLLATFSGKGLVPDAVLSIKSFPLAVALAAGSTVWLATRFGFPISTTHALMGGLVGVGLLSSPTGINFRHLLESFALPLLLGPAIAVLGTAVLYPILHQLKGYWGITEETCLCIGSEIVAVVPTGVPANATAASMTIPILTSGTHAECIERYKGRLLGMDAARLLDGIHYLSAGIVSFARGLNDTPKIAALLLAGNLFDPDLSIISIGIAMGVGGLLSARKIAQTMSLRVTEMNPGQGLTANLMTGILVIAGSGAGLPLSTTHVSCGSLFGIGAITQRIQWKTLTSILLSWVITLPMAAVLGYLIFFALRGLV
ncbi:MAG: inorganic phosphate transporter [Deltaproteobacteria bacterium]|nr:inorganic phosphate transporter [Deltaproteobacteria bacterium]